MANEATSSGSDGLQEALFLTRRTCQKLYRPDDSDARGSNLASTSSIHLLA